MVFSTDSQRRRLIFLVAIVVMVYSGYQSFRQSSELFLPDSEASVRTWLARDLFARNYENIVDSRGYHLLINSAAVAPLPTLSTLPFAWIHEGSGLGFYLVGALLAFGLVCYMPELVRLVGWHWMLGLIGGVAIVVVPHSPFLAWQSPQALGFLLIATAISTHMAAWLRSPRLSSLALAANWIGWGALWDIRILFAAAVLLAVVAGRALRPLDVAEDGSYRHASEDPWHPIPASAWRRLEGWLQIALLPILLPVSVWVLFNWLIFGNPERLLYGLPDRFTESVHALLVPVAGVSVLFFILSRLWSKARFAVVAIYGALLAASFFMGLNPERSAIAGEIVSTGPVRVSRNDLENLREYLLENTGGRLLVVVGRPGYTLLETLEGRGGLEHYLDIDETSLEKRTPGRDVYVILSQAQADHYQMRSGGPANWQRRFIQEATFGPWGVYRFLKPWSPGR